MQRFSKSITTPFLYAAIVIPLDTSSWKHIDFGKIKKNEVTFNKNITFNVDNSSSFLIHNLKSPQIIKSITVEIDVSKTLDIEADSDDYPFKLGLVIEGDKNLSGMKKFFAPKWIKDVYKFAGNNKGLDHIEMFIATFNKDLQGKKREHQKSDLFIENFVFSLKNKGIQRFTYKLDSPIKATALWLSADGDGSNAKFTTTIKSITFNQ
jgi:hypothetical protein